MGPLPYPLNYRRDTAPFSFPNYKPRRTEMMANFLPPVGHVITAKYGHKFWHYSRMRKRISRPLTIRSR